MREMVNAVFYLNRSGCQWDMLPQDLPTKSTATPSHGFRGPLRHDVVWKLTTSADTGQSPRHQCRCIRPHRLHRTSRVMNGRRVLRGRLGQGRRGSSFSAWRSGLWELDLAKRRATRARSISSLSDGERSAVASSSTQAFHSGVPRIMRTADRTREASDFDSCLLFFFGSVIRPVPTARPSPVVREVTADVLHHGIVSRGYP